MDKCRPELDLKHVKDICPDGNGMSKCYFMSSGLTRDVFQVPVIVVFTKFDQFKLDIEFQLEDENAVEGTDLDAEVEKKFDQYYRSELSGLSQTSPFIRLESEDLFQFD
jgi:hypothetical protein